MRIGFIQDDEDEPALTEMGHAETLNAEVSEDEGSWFDWARTVFLNFCLVNGLIDIVQDLLNYFR